MLVCPLKLLSSSAVPDLASSSSVASLDWATTRTHGVSLQQCRHSQQLLYWTSRLSSSRRHVTWRVSQ